MSSDILPYKIATELLEYFKINLNKEINIDFIIESLNIKVKQAKLKEGILGASKVERMNKLIVISQELDNPGRRRFTLAHELGHILMHQGFNYCNYTDFNIQMATKEKEQQANEFASELLLPREIILEELEYSDVSFELAFKICDTYNTSLLSTIIRLTRLTKDNIILIYHKDNRVLWKCPSEQAKYIRINNEEVDLARIEMKIDKEVQKVESEYWIEDNKFECFESTKYFKNLNEYLTIIEFIEQ